MRNRALVIVAMSLLVAFTASACGGGGGDGVDKGKVSSELQKSGMPKAQAECIATALDKAGLNYDDYKKYSGGQNLNDPKIKAYINDAIACMTAGGSTPGMPTTTKASGSDKTTTTEATSTDETTTTKAGGSTGKVDASTLSTQLQAGGMSKTQADCLAGALEKAGLTATDYTNIGKGGLDMTDPKLQAYIQEATQCMTPGG